MSSLRCNWKSINKIFCFSLQRKWRWPLRGTTTAAWRMCWWWQSSGKVKSAGFRVLGGGGGFEEPGWMLNSRIPRNQHLYETHPLCASANSGKHWRGSVSAWIRIVLGNQISIRIKLKRLDWIRINVMRIPKTAETYRKAPPSWWDLYKELYFHNIVPYWGSSIRLNL